MAESQNILNRIKKYVPDDRAVTVADLRALYAADADAIFELAIQGVSADAPMGCRQMEWLSRVLSVLMRDGFSIDTRAQQHYAVGNRGGYLALDAGNDDIQFIQNLNMGSGYASKLHSQKRSKACLDFFLDRHGWDDAVQGSKLLTIAPDDARAILGGLPKYQYDSLLDCAREVVRCPAGVYPGLRHRGTMKAEGWAFCGIPARRRMNDGTDKPAPQGFTFVVFVEPSGYVFDWDWVPSSDDDPAIPRDVDERFFGPRENLHAELLVGNIAQQSAAPFEPGQAWFSLHGDCVFCYLDSAESYAAREDEYLTTFYRLDEKQKCVGFKLKMVSQLFETIRRWGNTSDEGIRINFNADPVRVELEFLMRAWLEKRLPFRKELSPGMRLMEMLEQQSPPALEVPRQMIEELQATAMASKDHD